MKFVLINFLIQKFTLNRSLIECSLRNFSLNKAISKAADIVLNLVFKLSSRAT